MAIILDISKRIRTYRIGNRGRSIKNLFLIFIYFIVFFLNFKLENLLSGFSWVYFDKVQK
jgi:hypothetical protein